MARAVVLEGGWTWKGRSRHEDDVVEASEAQIRAWARRGYVRPLPPPVRPVRRATAQQAPAPENAAEVPAGPAIRDLGGGWYEVGGEKVQGRENAERRAAGG